MSLFEAQPYDPSQARKKRNIIIAIVFVVIILAIFWWQLRFWPEERVVDRFFDALQQQDFKQAYGIWMQDPNWNQHPQRYSRYTYDDFFKDWGPGGEWGIIKTHRISGAAVPHGYSGTPWATASGVVVEVTVNDRIADKAHIWVQKDDKTLGFSPY
ncbi:MAG TPA: hypothetical protein VKB58_02310 [Terriglobales bacterium]|nr:hypothetical protein [Terriglobales bacterium]